MDQFPQHQLDYRTPARARPKGLATASMVCEMCSIVGFCFWPISIPVAIAAIILGNAACRHINNGTGGGPGMARTGINCGSVVVLIYGSILVCLLVSAIVSSIGR